MHPQITHILFGYTFLIGIIRIGEKKIIFGRGQDGSVPAPELSLGAMMNNVDITLGTYASKDSTQAVNHTCTLENVPLQAWANIIVTLNNRSMDMYLDGKLVRTCVLPGVPKMSSGSPLVVSPGGGFEGYISNFQYYLESCKSSRGICYI